MNPELVQLSQLLAAQYLRNKGPVGFIDESYRDASRLDEVPFYLVTATLIPANELENSRRDYISVVGGYWWHTTEAYASKQFSLIRTFRDLIISHQTHVVISVQVRIVENDMEHARRECLMQIFARLKSLNCSLVVFERREDSKSRNADLALVSKAIRANLLPRDFKVFAGHPGAEPLLWGPDLVGWALRRQLAVGDSEWIKPLAESLELIDASEHFLLKTKGPQSAAAKDCGPGTFVGLQNEGKNRSSTEIMARETDFKKSNLKLFETMTAPQHNPQELRNWLKEMFPFPIQ